jgi:uncharacterized protein (UPF0333 family)
MNNKGGISKIIIYLVFLVVVALVVANFMPISKSMANSMTKDLIKCPSQSSTLFNMYKDKKITYLEYLRFKMACKAN